MSNAMTLFNGEAQMPAAIAAAFGDQENIIPRESTPALTFRGKTWRIRLDGKETVLTREVDGESFPIQSVQVVVLNMNPKRNRVMYQGGYNPEKPQSPVCWSSDSERPDADVKTPFAKTCASCPNSVKGSKITENGKETTACGFIKRVVVKPIGKLDMPPLLLKIPPTSIWDKDNPEAAAHKYFAWDQYADFLRQNGVKHTAAVVTRIKFDPNTEYPKLLFSPARWLEADEAAEVVPMVKEEDVLKLLTGKLHEGGEVEEPAAQEEFAPAPAPKAVAAPAPKAVAAPAPKAMPAPAPEPAQPAVAPATSTAALGGWDDDDTPPVKAAETKPAPAAKPAAKPAPKPAAAKPAPAQTAPAASGLNDLAALASAWE